MTPTAHGPSRDEVHVLGFLASAGGTDPDRLVDQVDGSEVRLDHALTALVTRSAISWNTGRGWWEITPSGMSVVRAQARPAPALPRLVRAADLLPSAA